MQVNSTMRLQKVFDLSGFVRREIVGDHVDLFAPGLVDDDVDEEGDELGRGVPGCCLAQHLYRAGVEGCVERERAMPVLLQPMPLRAARGERQDRIEAIEGLDRRLLIHAEYRRVL